MIQHPAGLVAVIAGILVFHGSIYVLVSLNVGWRFGYWLTSASMGALLLFLSAFWNTNYLGPRGEEPKWIPVAASRGPISQASLEGRTFSSPSAYPSGPWEAVPAKPENLDDETFRARLPKHQRFLYAEQDAFKTAVSNCLTASEESLKELELAAEREACRAAHALAPPEESLPRFAGSAVTVVFDVVGIRFAEEAGSLLAQAEVRPVANDPRLTGDPSGKTKRLLGEPFRILAVRDPGSVPVPARMYLLGSALYLAFHLWGLSRAERRKLSPVAV